MRRLLHSGWREIIAKSIVQRALQAVFTMETASGTLRQDTYFFGILTYIGIAKIRNTTQWTSQFLANPNIQRVWTAMSELTFARLRSLSLRRLALPPQPFSTFLLAHKPPSALSTSSTATSNAPQSPSLPSQKTSGDPSSPSLAWRSTGCGSSVVRRLCIRTLMKSRL